MSVSVYRKLTMSVSVYRKLLAAGFYGRSTSYSCCVFTHVVLLTWENTKTDSSHAWIATERRYALTSKRPCGNRANKNNKRSAICHAVDSLQLLEPGSTMADEETIDPSTIYYIYGEETEKAVREKNIYEAIDAPDVLSRVYDDILQNPTDSKDLEDFMKVANSGKKTRAAANYSFYIDAYSDVYGGRGWLCPYTAGELWVAVLVDIFLQTSD
ncbi:hypothetical protein J6590_037872 [Homalodisca vitripennis]|nr:hypothetical protein J6590_037872 [Homalodisca vitripennis]